MKVEIYSDVACPWCYVGKRRFERALAAFPGGDAIEVVYRPYQLDPAAPHEAAPLNKALERKFGAENLPRLHAQVRDAGRGENIDFAFDRALHVNTFTAHRLLRFALAEGGPAVQAAVKDALLRAYFTEGADVSDHATLADLAAGAGLDRDRVAAHLESGEGTAQTEADIERARAIGVTAVPTFVFEGRWAVQGAQEASTFLSVLEQVREQVSEEAREETGPGAAAGDGDGACADGACAV